MGGNDQGCKVHLVNWDVCCQPMFGGGLGFKPLRDLERGFPYEDNVEPY